MTDDQIDQIVIWALILTSVGDLLALLAELETQKNNRENERNKLSFTKTAIQQKTPVTI